MELLLSNKGAIEAPNFTPNPNHDWYLFPILMEDSFTGERWREIRWVNFKLQLGVYSNGSLFSPPILSRLTSTYDSQNFWSEKSELEKEKISEKESKNNEKRR